jgi:hypothetical protein
VPIALPLRAFFVADPIAGASEKRSTLRLHFRLEPKLGRSIDHQIVMACSHRRQRFISRRAQPWVILIGREQHRHAVVHIGHLCGQPLTMLYASPHSSVGRQMPVTVNSSAPWSEYQVRIIWPFSPSAST